VSLSSLLAACGGGDNGGGGGSASKEVTFGSNQSDAAPTKAYANMVAASGMTVKVNTVDQQPKIFAQVLSGQARPSRPAPNPAAGSAPTSQ
jgi:hypothetical protein